MGQVFQVLTEFKFDATGAIAQSKVLESAVDGVSVAADRALDSLRGLALGASAALGLGSTLGMLKAAIDVSDKFHSSVLDFSTVIATNMQFLQGSVGTFNDRLGSTKQIMLDISKVADQMDVSQGDLFSIVKASIPQLAPHGAAGSNFKNAINLSGQALVAGSNLGLGSTDIAAQLAQLLSGTATEGGLAGRLMGTKAMRGVGGVSGLNDEAFNQRLKRLSEGLKELGSDMGYVSERANSISAQLKRMKDLVLGDENGMGSILKPLGDTLAPIFITTLKRVNSYIKNEGAAIVGNMSQLVKSMISTPEKMIIDLLQFKNLKSDFHEATGIVKTVGVVTGVGSALAWLTGKAIFAAPGIGVVAGIMGVLASAFRRAEDPISQAIGTVIKWVAAIGAVAGALAYFDVLLPVLAFLFSEILVPLALFTVLMQALSRAVAQAHVDDAKDMAEMAPHLSELFVRLKMALHNIIDPIQTVIQGWADIFEPLFRWSGWLQVMMPLLDKFVGMLELIGDVLVGSMGVISGMITAVIGMIDNAMHLKNPLTDVGDNFKNGFDDYMKTHLQKMDAGGNISNQITNIGRVEIRNDFKETQEPDRIAFTMKEQILKAAQNPKQARGQASQLGFAQR